MRAYLVTHPPTTRQFRRPRRATPSGLIVVHTAENTPDAIGPDAGAEAVAAWISRRPDFGSYHRLSDADSRLQLVPYDAEAYGDGTGSNPYAVHISSATRAADWPGLSVARRDALVANLAADAAHAARWLRKHHHIVVPAQRLTRAESEARHAGFIAHADRDPGRRSDPGPAFPWDRFLAEYRREMATSRVDQVRRLLWHAIRAPYNRARPARQAQLRAARAQLPRKRE